MEPPSWRSKLLETQQLFKQLADAHAQLATALEQRKLLDDFQREFSLIDDLTRQTDTALVTLVSISRAPLSSSSSSGAGAAPPTPPLPPIEDHSPPITGDNVGGGSASLMRTSGTLAFSPKRDEPIELAFQAEEDEEDTPQSRAAAAIQRGYRRYLRNTGRKPTWVSILSEYSKTPEAARRRHRNQVQREIVSTERFYVIHLRFLERLYMQPMLQLADKQSPENAAECRSLISTVFGNAQVILGYNEVLLSDLTRAVYQWPYSCVRIGAIFHKVIPFFKEYALYVKNYQKSIDILCELSTHTKRNQTSPHKLVYQWMTEIESSSRAHLNGLMLSDLLIMPVQRVPRYVLLLEDLLKHTPEEHVDRLDLVNAISEMRSVANYINKQQSFLENQNKVCKIQQGISGEFPNLVEPHRFFVREGPIIRMSDRAHQRTMILFNDLILFVRSSNILRRAQEAVPTAFAPSSDITGATDSEGEALSYLRYFDGIMSLYGAVLDDIVEINNAFRLIGPANSGSVTLVCPSAEDKASWMKDITNAIAGTIVSADPDGSEESWRQEQQSDAEQPASASSSSSSLPMVAGGRTSVQLSGPPSLSVIETDVAPRRERRSGPVLNRSSRCWQGYLLKQEGSFVKIWERRWVVLGQDGTLFLYKDKGNTTPLRSLNLPSLVLTGVFRTSDRAFYYLNFDPKPFKDGILEGLMGFAATKGAPMASVQIGSFSKEMMQLWVYVFRKHLNIDPECLQSTQMDFSNPPPSLVVDSAGGVISVRKAGGADHLLHPIDSDASLKSPQKPQASQEQQQQQHPDLNAGDDDDDEPDTTSQPASARSTPQRSPSVVTASAIGAEQQILFREKFQLPATENVLEWFTLASGGYIYISEQHVCLDLLFKSERTVIPISEIRSLHKHTGLFGAATEGQIETNAGKIIDLSGMLRRRDIYSAIIAQAKALGHTIAVFRDGSRE